MPTHWVAILGKVVENLQDYLWSLIIDCSRVVQHALVWGLGGHVKPDPIVPAKIAQTVDSAVQSDPS